MQRTRFLALMLCLGSALLAGCGGSSGFSSPAGTPSTSLSIRDTPPAGVDVLSFEITVTGAVLQPGNVSLISSPLNVEIKKLEATTAYLSGANVPPGNYSSIQVTFANPDLTILNNSGAAIGSNCAPGAVCELKPTLNSASVNFSGTPFPLTINPSGTTGLVLDFDLSNSIQNNLSVTPTITFAQLPAVQGTGELEEIEYTGQVKSVGSSQFTVQTALSGATLTVSVNSNTQWEDFASCTTNDIRCLGTGGQTVQVELGHMTDGSYLAKEVELEANSNEQEVEGVVYSVDTATQCKLVVLDEEPAVNGVAVGNWATVTLVNSSFSIAHNDLDASAFSFNSSADLLVGQELEVRPVSATSSPTGVLITTDRVRLRMSQYTAHVAAISGNNFTVDNLPGLFTQAGITQIQVNTSSQTKFENVSGVAGLTVGATVSVEGLLFKTPGGPVLVAKEVRKR